jgi:hypothetical protein
MSQLDMPKEREYGWDLKPTASTLFDIHQKPNAQFCVVLNHSLLRGVTSEMIHWWFLNFPNLRVRLENVPDYQEKTVPGYLLWHPYDHCSATLKGKLGPDGTSQPGAKIHIKEVMQYKTYGLKYPVDTALSIFYCAGDGWAMGKVVPLLGKVMCLRIHFKDVFEGDQIVGVHYHYEVVIGASANNPLARAFNRKLTSKFSPEFFEAWQLHNTIEVGTFENFLPALYAQRSQLRELSYNPNMNGMAGVKEVQSAQDRNLFEERVAGYKDARDPHKYQAAEKASFL